MEQVENEVLSTTDTQNGGINGLAYGSGENSLAVDTPAADAASAEKMDGAPAVLEVTASQASPTMDEIYSVSGTPVVGNVQPEGYEIEIQTSDKSESQQPAKPKAFSIARVDACVLSMWEHVNAGSHDVIEEIEKLLGIKG